MMIMMIMMMKHGIYEDLQHKDESPKLSQIPGRGRDFYSQPHPEELWGPPSLLSDRYAGHFPQS
jgi:phage terminase large subunit GpA-like protein